ncbi:hypothetical protein Tco_0164192 [Tanacetum coccineum]
MVVLASCPKHNMVAYLEKTDGNAEFHEIIDFLARSSIHNALTISPVVSTTFVEQVWMSAKSKIINNVRETFFKGSHTSVSNMWVLVGGYFKKQQTMRVNNQKDHLEPQHTPILPRRQVKIHVEPQSDHHIDLHYFSYSNIPFQEFWWNHEGQFNCGRESKIPHETQLQLQRRFSMQNKELCNQNRPATRTQLRNQMMTYLKHVGNKKHSDLKNKTFEEIQALYEKVKRFDESFTTVGSTENERKIKEMNEGAKDLEQKRLKNKVAKETPKKEDTAKVPAKVTTPDGDYLVFYRAHGKPTGHSTNSWRYFISLTSKIFHMYERLDDGACTPEIPLEELKLILWGESEDNEWKSSKEKMINPRSNSSGKGHSNLLIADSLLKTIWFINAPCYGNEALASPKANELTIPEQTATGKGKSNPFKYKVLSTAQIVSTVSIK